MDVVAAGHVDGPVRPDGRRRRDSVEPVQHPPYEPGRIHGDQAAGRAHSGPEIQRPVGPDGGRRPDYVGKIQGPKHASLRREGVPMASSRRVFIPPDVDRAVGSHGDTGHDRSSSGPFRKGPFERNGPVDARPFPNGDRQPPRHSLTGRRDGRRAVAQPRDKTSGPAGAQNAVPRSWTRSRARRTTTQNGRDHGPYRKAWCRPRPAPLHMGGTGCRGSRWFVRMA